MENLIEAKKPRNNRGERRRNYGAKSSQANKKWLEQPLDPAEICGWPAIQSACVYIFYEEEKGGPKASVQFALRPILESGFCPNCLVARLVQDNLLQPVSPEKFGYCLFWAEREHVETVVGEFSAAAFGVRHGFVHMDGGMA